MVVLAQLGHGNFTVPCIFVILLLHDEQTSCNSVIRKRVLLVIYKGFENYKFSRP